MIVWAVMLVLFNVIAFMSFGIETVVKYTPSFWIGYGAINLMFILQLVCTAVAFKSDSAQKMFYKLSLITTSYSGLVATFIVGGICMLFAPLYWVGVIVCAIVLALNVIAVVKASAVAGEITKIDEKVKAQTFFIKTLTVDAQSVMARAQSETVKAECKKVYEAVRYSDPMSRAELMDVEEQIKMRFSAFFEAVVNNDEQAASVLANDVIVLLGDRNNKCKLLK